MVRVVGVAGLRGVWPETGQGSFGESGTEGPILFRGVGWYEGLCVRDAEGRPKGGSRRRRDGAIANPEASPTPSAARGHAQEGNPGNLFEYP